MVGAAFSPDREFYRHRIAYRPVELSRAGHVDAPRVIPVLNEAPPISTGGASSCSDIASYWSVASLRRRVLIQLCAV